MSGSAVPGRTLQRIAVIGCGGSGKTTLANGLGRRLDLPVVHLDEHFWIDGVPRDEASWIETHRALIGSDRWVMDGMKFGTLFERIAQADLVVFLDVSTASCLRGVFLRRLRYGGAALRAEGIYDRINLEFLRWVLAFRRKVRPRILEMLPADRSVVLRDHREANSWLAGS